MRHLTSSLGPGVAQAAASIREPAVAASAAEPSLRNLVESYAQEAGMEFLPKARQHEGLQVSLISLRLAHSSPGRKSGFAAAAAKVRRILQIMTCYGIPPYGECLFPSLHYLTMQLCS